MVGAALLADCAVGVIWEGVIARFGRHCSCFLWLL